jgi:hypothetical protein
VSCAVHGKIAMNAIPALLLLSESVTPGITSARILLLAWIAQG